MKRYHFSFGNSTYGAVGFCATVCADSMERAAFLLREALPDEMGVLDYKSCAGKEGVEYIRAYFNSEAITVEDAEPETETEYADVLYRDEGTVWALTGVTDQGVEWMRNNMETEPYQWTGSTVIVGHRYAQDIIDGMRRDGLTVESAYEEGGAD